MDEPTSGMDPIERREMWDIIKQAKKNKLIILSTHYMDEAEFLADRVAIIAGGHMKAAGSPLFLKEKFGTGFVLSIEKLDNASSLDELEKLLTECLPGGGDDWGLEWVKNETEAKADYKLPRYISMQFKKIFE